jgi:anti-repressor protein
VLKFKQEVIQMSNLVSFAFKNNNVRVIEKEGEPWFVGKDVADVLGYSNPRKALLDHCKAAIPVGSLRSNDSLPLDKQTKIISERDVYRLIMRSKKAEAEQFEEWVVGTVLPSIRKNGGYIADQEQLTPEQIVANALVVAQNIISQQQQQLVSMTPKAEQFDRFMNSKTTYTTTELAKQLGTTAVKLNKFLRDNGIKMDNGKDLPKAGYEDWFEVIDRVFTDNANNTYTKPQCRIKPEGIKEIRKMFI